jgi:hypothetical protein
MKSSAKVHVQVTCGNYRTEPYLSVSYLASPVFHQATMVVVGCILMGDQRQTARPMQSPPAIVDSGSRSITFKLSPLASSPPGCEKYDFPGCSQAAVPCLS